tara:strand:- start:194 stop:1831 length:1638 start_codon:yes stop_codon:yes gene_type:complete
MSILNVDKIQPIGSGSTVTVNATDTILTNAQAGVITATRFDGIISATTDDWVTHQSDSNTRMGFPATDTFAVETAGGERLRITSGGNIGIGEDVPDLKLHVNGVNGLPATSGTTPVGHLILRAKAQNASHGMYMGVSNAGPWSSWIQAADANNLATTYPLLLNPNGGNIGINCTPSKQLQVKGIDVAFRLESTAATGRIGMEFYDTSAQKGFFGYPSSGNDHMSIQQNEAADLYFYVNGGERLRIKSDGDITTAGTTKIKPHSVGIGTTSITNTGVGTAYGEMMYNTTTNNVQVYTTTNLWYNVSDLQGYYKTPAAASSDGMNHYWGGTSSTSIISGLTPNGSPGGSPNTPTVGHTAQSYYGDYPYFDFASGTDQVGYEFTKSGTSWGAGPFSICFWVDLQGATLESESTFVQIGNHSGSRSLYSVSADADRKLKAITIGDDTGVSSDAQLIGNTWHHVAVTYNTSRVTKYYMDGSLVRSHTHNSAMQIGHSAQHIYLGYGYWNSSAGNKAAMAHMSDIGIWDAKELNATEIKNIYNAKRIIRGY